MACALRHPLGEWEVQAFSEKYKLPCELSQPNVLWSELDKSAWHQAQEKCIFQALVRVRKVHFEGIFS
jgi:hypothetical protein